MIDIESRLWAWYNSVAGRPWQLRTWDCFQLLLDGQATIGLGRAFEPTYRKGASTPGGAARALSRNFVRGFSNFTRVDPQPGAAVLFRERRVPVHVGLYLGANRMAHVNVHTATTIAEIGPRSDYFFSLDGFYVPA
ncbi:MAG: hypothetical protein AAFW60_01545 [Pseudomonadota bacterium]